MPPDERRRIDLTTSCHDSDDLPRHPKAGQFDEHKGVEVQYMHNGIRVVRGGYYGDWMAEIIQRLKGVHEPQEEKAVAAVLSRLRNSRDAEKLPVVVELGSFWAYYSLWFLEDFNDGHAICLEPDPANLEIGIRNFQLNNRTGTFISGVVGDRADTTIDFVAESDGISRPTRVYSLRSLMTEAAIDHIDILFVDIQGAEQDLFTNAQSVLTSGLVRFVVVSTHDLDISGSPMTHRDVENLLLQAGAHIVCEHSVSESFSGDGLIVASFSRDDVDFDVSLSRARAVDSLFGEWEPRLESALKKLAELEKHADSRHESDAGSNRVRELKDSLSWRLASRLRARLRRLRFR